MTGARGDVRKLLERISEDGTWITTTLDTFHGTMLSRSEWPESACLRYGMHPLNLQDCCNDCGQGFSIEHGLNCKTGGLVGLTDNDARDKAVCLSEATLGKTYVSYKLMIFSGTDVLISQPGTLQGAAIRCSTAGNKAQGDVMLHRLWKRGEGDILDLHITGTGQPTHRGLSLEEVLKRQARAKKDFYLQACVERRRLFVPLKYHVDGMTA